MNVRVVTGGMFLCLLAATAPAMDQLEVANMHAAHGRVTAALEAYGQAIASEPMNRAALEARAFYYLNLNRIPEALDDFSTMISRFPSYTAAYLSRGLLYSQQGDAELAEADFTAACARGDSAGCSFVKEDGKP